MRQALATLLVLLLGVLAHPIAVGRACVQDDASRSDAQLEIDELTADDDESALAPIADEGLRPLLTAALAPGACARAQAERCSPSARSRGPPT